MHLNTNTGISRLKLFTKEFINRFTHTHTQINTLSFLLYIAHFELFRAAARFIWNVRAYYDIICSGAVLNGNEAL